MFANIKIWSVSINYINCQNPNLEQKKIKNQIKSTNFYEKKVYNKKEQRPFKGLRSFKLIQKNQTKYF